MIHFVGAGPGAVDLITVRGQRYLKEADVIIYAGSLVNKGLLEYAKEGCEVYNSAYMTLEEVCEDTTLVIETAEDTSGGESKDPDKDKDPGKNPDKDKDPNKGTPGTGKGHESEKKTPLNKLKNQMAAVTGDEARPMLYALAAIAAAAVISVTVIRRKNK